MTRVWSSLMLATTLAGCDPDPEHDVQYWLDHPDERAAALAVCTKGPAADAEHQGRYRVYWVRRGEQGPWATSLSP